MNRASVGTSSTEMVEEEEIEIDATQFQKIKKKIKNEHEEGSKDASSEEEEEQPAGTTLTTSTPLVLDNGGGLLKAGLCGSDPYRIPSLVGTPKHARVMLQTPSTEKYFG